MTLCPLKVGALGSFLQCPSFSTGTQPYSLNSCFSFSSSRFGHLIFIFKSMGFLKCYHGFFAMNHTNYARWLPVHLRDMRSLDQKVPHVASEFKKGMFTVNKTLKRFSAIAINQAHEQNNAMVKGEGGAVGLMENRNALHRWMLSGPEMARLVNEFEAGMAPDTGTKENSKHHEEHRSSQRSSKATQQISSMKRDCSLFSRMHISCQTRNGDLDEFFRHENQGFPPSLSDQGNLRLPKKKSELTECLQALTVPQSQMQRNVNVGIIIH